jgi:RNA polymerase sigma-70 factor (ECF subfamily)
MFRVRAGDAQAFTELYERHGGALLTFLTRLTGDRRLGEDLLQETFIRLYRSRGEYEATGRFRAFVFTIARRLVIDWRRSQKATWLEESEALETLEAPERSGDRADARDLADRLEAALRRLPASQRETVLLSRYAGLSAEEIAQVTGSTPGAVRVGLHRALRQLRELIEPDESSGRREGI